MPPEDLARFRHLCDRGIYEALVRNNPVRSGEPSGYLTRFVSWLFAPSPGFGVITTNYDTLVDRRLFRAIDPHLGQASQIVGEAVDFGFAWRDVDLSNLIVRPKTPQFSLLKLHGSLSWLRCSLCGQLYLNTAGPIGTKAFERVPDQWNTCECNEWARLRLHLVTPSLVRQMQDPHLLGSLRPRWNCCARRSIG